MEKPTWELLINTKGVDICSIEFLLFELFDRDLAIKLAIDCVEKDQAIIHVSESFEEIEEFSNKIREYNIPYFYREVYVGDLISKDESNPMKTKEDYLKHLTEMDELRKNDPLGLL